MHGHVHVFRVGEPDTDAAWARHTDLIVVDDSDFVAVDRTVHGLDIAVRRRRPDPDAHELVVERKDARFFHHPSRAMAGEASVVWPVADEQDARRQVFATRTTYMSGAVVVDLCEVKDGADDMGGPVDPLVGRAVRVDDDGRGVGAWLVRPRRLFVPRGVTTSHWTLLSDDGGISDAIVVVKDGVRRVTRRPLTRGLTLDDLCDGGFVDDAIARGVVQAAAGVTGEVVVGYDGRVGALDDRPRKSEDRRKTFARLVGAWRPGVDAGAVDSDDDGFDVAAIAERFRVARPAPAQAIAAFVQSVDPQGHQRHAEVLEELELWRMAHPPPPPRA